MTALLLRLLVPGWRNPERPAVRHRCGMLSGIVGIVLNLLLSGLKLFIGISGGSIAIAADGLNNLGDCGSGVVTLGGFIYAGKPADAEHPFGHGRFEYVGGMVVAVIIIAVGGALLKDSVLRLFAPAPPAMPPMLLWIYGGSILVKVWLGLFYRRIGNLIDSQIIRGQALDCLGDILATAVVFAAVMQANTGVKIPLDAIAGCGVALFILWSGVGLFRSTLNPLLGECPSPHLTEELRKCLLEIDGINGVHDIIVHDYGPGRHFASAHAEIDPGHTLVAAHDLMESAEKIIHKRLGVMLLLHCDPFRNDTPEVQPYLEALSASANDCCPGSVVSDFRVVENRGDGQLTLDFDLTLPAGCTANQKELHRELTLRLKERLQRPVRLKIDFKVAYS